MHKKHESPEIHCNTLRNLLSDHYFDLQFPLCQGLSTDLIALQQNKSSGPQHVPASFVQLWTPWSKTLKNCVGEHMPFTAFNTTSITIWNKESLLRSKKCSWPIRTLKAHHHIIHPASRQVSFLLHAKVFSKAERPFLLTFPKILRKRIIYGQLTVFAFWYQIARCIVFFHDVERTGIVSMWCWIAKLGLTSISFFTIVRFFFTKILIFSKRRSICPEDGSPTFPWFCRTLSFMVRPHISGLWCSARDHVIFLEVNCSKGSARGQCPVRRPAHEYWKTCSAGQ